MEPAQITVVALVTLAGINAIASAHVLKADAFSGRQRLLQLTTIWLLPLIGAIICLLMIAALSPRRAHRSSIDPLRTPSDGGQPSEGVFGFGDVTGGDGGD